MKSAVTVALVPEARGGPFVFHDDLAAGVAAAARYGFDAVELFPRGPAAVDARHLRTLLADAGLALAAVGSGAGWVAHGLTLTDPDPGRRQQALDFARALIDFAGAFQAPVIVGSMQGKAPSAAEVPAYRSRLGEALADLGGHARPYRVPVLFEPLNRYETNLANTLADGVALLAGGGAGNVRLLADLFHANVEEADIPRAVRDAGPHVGHVHLADSNRRAAGLGHTDFGPIISALRDTGYAGYLSAEVFPLPDPDTAARQTTTAITALRRPV